MAMAGYGYEYICLFLFNRSLPIWNRDLLATCHGECARRRIFRHGRTSAHRATRSNGQGGHQYAVATDMHISLDGGLVFVRPVIVGGNTASAIVHALTNLCITQIGQVVSFGAVG